MKIVVLTIPFFFFVDVILYNFENKNECIIGCPEWYKNLSLEKKQKVKNIISVGTSKISTKILVIRLMEATESNRKDCEDLLKWWFSSEHVVTFSHRNVKIFKLYVSRFYSISALKKLQT